MSAKKQKNPNDLIEIGQIGRPHGVRGAFFISGRDDPLPKHYEKIVVGDVERKVVERKVSGGRPVCRVEGIDSPEALKELKGTKLLIERQKIALKKNHEILLRDLEGAQVFAEQRLLGEVEEILLSKAHPILRIVADTQKELFLPFTDEFVCIRDEGDTLYVELVKSLHDLEDLWQ